ncbi:dTDP-4-dehydrorhamnose 3,5-epimerase family protein [Pelagibacteraceae bacterium]|nr:dTDP-4-dehydrorhamnose 3,5-epimerase family protein [Pelagibacteraceae bacterium]|tara:strand:- start:68 stop:526 length:459 start_codon:yes stop_codon:yes gene_type:complete
MQPKKIKLNKFDDERGYLLELLPKELKNIFKYSIITSSKKNVIRGLHYDKFLNEKKLIYVLKGEILDVTVNIKKNKKIYYNKLKKGDALFIPSEFAHGYKCIARENVLLYFLSKDYNPNNQKGIFWKDNKLKIKWNIKTPIISTKDKMLPNL